MKYSILATYTARNRAPPEISPVISSILSIRQHDKHEWPLNTTADKFPTPLAHVGGFGFERPVEGNTNDWLTPPGLLQRLGTFDLDPCGCAGMPWRTATTPFCLLDHDGLVEPWHGRIFCNPPYGPNVRDWARRMAAHGNGIMLIFLRSDTVAWQRDIFPLADAALLLAGRVHFYLPSGERGKSGTAPSALVAYGQNNVDTLRNAGIAGALVLKAEMLTGLKASQF